MSDIQNVEAKTMLNQDCLTICYKEGKVKLYRTSLPDSEAFDLVCKLLARRRENLLTLITLPLVAREGSFRRAAHVYAKWPILIKRKLFRKNVRI